MFYDIGIFFPNIEVINIWNIEQQIEEASKKLNIKYFKLSLEEFEKLTYDVVKKYTNEKKHFPLWERLTDFVGTTEEDSWMWIADFIREDEAILFFNPLDERNAYLFRSGREIVSIIEEIYNVEFYITNKMTDYLLCYNHHRCLFSSGRAIEWLESR